MCEKPGTEGSEPLLWLEGQRAEPLPERVPPMGASALWPPYCTRSAPRSLGCQAHSAPVIAASGPHSDPSFPSLLPPLHPPGLVLRPHTRELPRRPHHRSAQPLSLPGHRLPLQLQGVLRTLSLPSWLPHEPSSQMRSLVGAEAQKARTTDGRREEGKGPAASSQPLGLGPLPHPGECAAILGL